VPLAVNRAEPVVLQGAATPFGAAIIDVVRSLGGGVEVQTPRMSRLSKRFSFGRS